MGRILGLDLGSTSIGWSIIEVDEHLQQKKILGMGTRIISLNTNERNEFQKGQSITKHQDRTSARSQRKGYDRKRRRKSNLKNILQRLGIFPTQELLRISKLDLWKLRSDAAERFISAAQLGRVLYMLSQKRGYKSLRSESSQDKKDSDYLLGIKDRYQELHEKNQTIGQFFYGHIRDADQGDDYFRVKEKVYPRSAYIEEFDRIIDVQKVKHEFLTETVVESLRYELYYQRPLKSQKSLVSVCELEGFNVKYLDKKSNETKELFTGPRTAPRTSPLNQLCKIWETVNNISLKVKSDIGAKQKWTDKVLTISEKQKVAEFLSINAKLSYSDLLKLLGLRKEEIYANKQIQKDLQGNVTYAEIHKITGDCPYLQFNISKETLNREGFLVDQKTGEILEKRLGVQLNSDLENEPMYQLWHTIYSIKDLGECRNALIKRFGFDDVIAEQLAKIDFNKYAFANKSNKAMRKILPYLMDGFGYAAACSLAGYNHSNSLTKVERDNLKTDNRLELLAKNSLRQPVVEKVLNQMINVVNSILEKYGHLDEIRVELSRELKQSKEQRNDADIYNSNNKKLNDRLSKKLEELGLPVTKRMIQKYKLVFPTKDITLKEDRVSPVCIYCGQIFGLSAALTGDAFDIDHIIPKTLLFDDSQTNKVLVHRACNSNKGDHTAYDYMAKKGSVELDTYLNRVEDWFKRGIISYSKAQRLKVSFEEYKERKKLKKETEADKRLWESFIDRQLRETQYISRKSVEILSRICNKVMVTEGSVTAKLRKLWGWEDVLKNLQLPKYKQLGHTSIRNWTSEHGKHNHSAEEIENWTKRDDHRHHAIDALVVACTKQGFIQRINTLSSSDVKDDMKNNIDRADFEYNRRLTLLDNYLCLQQPFYISEVEDKVRQILISFKPGKRLATLSKYKAKGKNLQKGVLVPRGALHEDSVYGKIKVIAKDFKTGNRIKFPLKYLFENADLIVDSKVQQLIKTRLESVNQNIPDAVRSLKKAPIYLDDSKSNLLDGGFCYKDEIVIKYKLIDFKEKDLKYIVDDRVKKIVSDRLSAYNNVEKEAFKDTLWFNEEKKIPIRTIRCFTGLSAVEAVRKDEDGNSIGFSKPGNNHHLVIYRDIEGKYSQHICSFWHAVERKRFGLPYVIKDTHIIWTDILDQNLPQNFIDHLPADHLHLHLVIEQNEMFVFGLSDEEFEDALRTDNYALISDHLYLAWSISDNDYWFRHHLETKNSELKNIEGAKESRRYYRFKSVAALIKANPIKLRLNNLGEITKLQSSPKRDYEENDFESSQPMILAEPSAVYHQTNRISFFNSFESAGRSEVLSIINQSPVDRLRNAVELILRVYNVTREILKQKKPNRSIRIIRDK